MARLRTLNRAERAAQTRAAIVETAARLFLRAGIEATSLDRVAAELGLTKGAVYASFPSKGALAEAVAAANSSPGTIFAALLEPGLSLAARVRAFGTRLVSTKVSRQVVLLDLEYAIYAARNGRWDKAAREGFRIELDELVERFRAVNEASGDRLPITERRFLLLLNLLGRGLIQELVLHPGSLSPEDVGEMVQALLPARRSSRA